MIATPLGEIIVQIDNSPVWYKTEKMKLTEICKNLDGRYRISVPFLPDGKRHEITCFIRDYKPTKKDGVESGERLELKSFYDKSCKVSLGMEGDSGYFLDGSQSSMDYDYDNDYTDNGVKYIILEGTTTTEYLFGVAWINTVTDDNDVQTWFGADPTFM